MKLRKQKDDGTIVHLSNEAQYQPAVGFLGPGWVDPSRETSTFYPLHIWQPIPGDQWEDVTYNIMVYDAGIAPAVKLSLGDQYIASIGTDRNLLWLPYRFVKQSLWDCLEPQTKQLLSGFQQFALVNLVEKMKTIMVLRVERKKR